MALSTIATISSHMMISTSVAKPKNVNFLTTIGPFTTVFGGTAGNYTSSTTRTITGTQFYDGTYTIKCNYWTMEGTISAPTSSLGMMFDNNSNTFGSSVWTGSGVVNFGYNGNQTGFIGQAYNTGTTGAYNLGTTYKTTANLTDYVGDYIDVIYPMSVIMKEYRIMIRTNATARYPRQMYFFGSNDGLTWVSLHSALTTTTTTAGTFTGYPFPATTIGYTNFRMVINTVGSTSGGFWNIAEINMIFDVV